MESKLIGSIDILISTLCGSPKENAMNVLNIMKDVKIKGKTINIEHLQTTSEVNFKAPHHIFDVALL